MIAIAPHGGKLIEQILSKEKSKKILSNQDSFGVLAVDEETLKDAKNIARGLYSPLTGFLNETDFLTVVNDMRLASGVVWSIPIVLDISRDAHERVCDKKELLLTDQYGTIHILIRNPEFYMYDRSLFAQKVYGTEDHEHPGVAEIFAMGDHLVGGDVWLVSHEGDVFADYALTPRETRAKFSEKGWETVVAFQTRNVPHCGHEFLQMKALEGVDGLFVQPVIGRKKSGDFKDEIIMSSYEVLIETYYPRNKVLLGALPVRMRYAGPREALFHALIRKNFGCTHFIVGRDHAGVGNYYSPFAAQEIFDEFQKNDIGIDILKLPEVVYCSACEKHTFVDGCPHTDAHIAFSGTKLREYIQKKEQPPLYVIRPEVYFLLLNNANPLVDAMYQRQNKQKGFVLWFTGLSQAGKTTTANEVYARLKDRGLVVERLDGDVVRQSLTADLGFSKADRDENIKRVGYIAKLFSDKGIIVIASFISPYRAEREKLRFRISSFIEVFVNAPVGVCENRDTKGLYKKARSGEIPNFTGISDPYEEPESPEVELHTDTEPVEACADRVVHYLEEHRYIENK